MRSIFSGNETPFSTNDPVGGFRLLDYYRFSTDDRYFSANVHYQFRKFLVTTIPVVRPHRRRPSALISQ
jgi:hypothetical protein